jgi:hypothetical protein
VSLHKADGGAANLERILPTFRVATFVRNVEELPAAEELLPYCSGVMAMVEAPPISEIACDHQASEAWSEWQSA